MALPRLLCALALIASSAACGDSRRATPQPLADDPLPALPVPAILPASFAAADHVGAAACAECHRAIYDQWQRSPHGRAMSPATPAAVLAAFDGAPVALADGTVRPYRDGDRFFMEIVAGAHRETRRVDLTLASGRQHQVYATSAADGAHRLLPIIWATRARQWLPLSLYQPAELSPGSPRHWAAGEMTRTCFGCHLSQAHRTVDAAGGRTAWVDLSINCESCHGPGREHVARRKAGRTDEVYRKLDGLSSAQEARVCGVCHGLQLEPYAFPRAADGQPETFVASLAAHSFRADGTQKLTSYQYTGHVLTGGYRMDLMTCNDCHAPHGLTARNRSGESAEGAQVNRQCTVCHPDMAAPAAITAHSHHTPRTTCIDCHMPYSWIGDDARRHQRTSDHSIGSPHPRETVDLGLPNACNSCHTDKDPAWSLAALERWDQKRVLGVREHVRTVADARRTLPGATDRLLAMLADADAGPYLHASALDLLAIQPVDARVIAAVTPLADAADPQLRAAALRALDRHDPTRRAAWHAHGLADPHPYVRMQTFTLVRDPAELGAAALDRQLADVLAFQSPPTEGLLHLVDLYRRRNDPAHARQLLDLLDKIAVPWERDRPGRQ